MTLSIIIAVKAWQKNLEECVSNCVKLDFGKEDFEILVMIDDLPSKNIIFDVSKLAPNLVFYATGNVNPAKKRDMSMEKAKGKFLAFLDDDAFPAQDWLNNTINDFKDPEVAAVGGPAVTPASDSLRQKASGLVYSSLLVSGNYFYRYLPGRRMFVEDFPSCNFIVRREVMLELGGFKTDYWPGEDTKFCRDIIISGKKILYDPLVLVFHHRRKIFLPHLKQIASYALHRGYFAKRYPETSLKLSYFIPSLFLLYLVLGSILTAFIPLFRMVYYPPIFLYLVLALILSISNTLKQERALKLRKKPLLITGVFIGIILTHLCYGLFFIKGLLSRKLKEDSVP